MTIQDNTFRLLGAVLVGLCLATTADEVKKPLDAGELAAPFALCNLEGKHVFLRTYCGKDAKPPRVVLLNFWATWCAPCMREMPLLLAALKKFDSTKIACFMIAENKAGEADQVKKVAKDKGISDYVLLDPYGKALKKYNPVGTVPLTFVILPNGTIQECLPFSEDGAAYQARLEAALTKALAASASTVGTPPQK